MRVAVLAGHRPEASETFIVHHLRALRDHRVDFYPATAGGGAFDLPGVRFLEPPAIPVGLLARALGACGLAARHALREPGRVARALFPGDPYARSLRLLYHLGRAPEEYDVLHAHFGPNGVRALSLRRVGLLRGPLVTSFHGHDVNVVPRVEGAGIYRDLFRHGELFTFSSRFVARRLEELGAPPSRMARIRVGVDVERFSCRPRRLEGPLALATVARLVEVKGIRHALDAVARVEGAIYRIVGDGPLRPLLEEQARALGIDDRVEFLGALPPADVADVLLRSHLYVQPSVVTREGAEEGQGLALLEAQASGLPVIATRTGGIPESLRENESGVLVPAGDAPALAGAIADLAAAADRWPAMGEKGRAFVAAEFSAAAAESDLFAAYEQLKAES